MRFTRATRFDPIAFDSRQAASARKQQRERNRHSLIAEHLAAELQPFDEDAGRRQHHADNLGRTTRKLGAETWRSARRQLIAHSEPVKAHIWEKRSNWRGPRT